MGAVFYYLLTFAESVTSVFGVRFPYEQPHYVVEQTLPDRVEVRRYEARAAIEATIDRRTDPNAPNTAFGLLFNYITGANQQRRMIAMTVPVRMDSRPERIAMTVPVQSQDSGPDSFTMRFYLPASVVRAGAPVPLDARLHVAEVPAGTIAALRYSGIPTADANRRESARLLSVLAASHWRPQGGVFELNYDPPFTIPFLRRNEVAVNVSGPDKAAQ